MLTPDQQAELERRGFLVTSDGRVGVCGYLMDPKSDVWRVYMSDFALAAAILGITPPGYRLVPEVTAAAGIRHVEAARAEARDHLEFCQDVSVPGDQVWVDMVAEAKRSLAEIEALASALSPKEVELRE